MNRFFIDISEKITTLYTADRNIVSYEENDYPVACSVPDELYSKMKGLDIGEVMVVLHGEIVSDNSGSLKIGDGGSVIDSVSDIKALEHTFRALGISKFSFFDYSGFILFGLTGRNLIVEFKNGLFHLTAFNNSTVLDSVVCTESTFKDSADSAINKNSLTAVIDANRIQNDKLTQYFTNVASINQQECADYSSVLHYLSLFAFTMTKISNECMIDVDKLITESSTSSAVAASIATIAREEKHKPMMEVAKLDSSVPTDSVNEDLKISDSIEAGSTPESAEIDKVKEIAENDVSDLLDLSQSSKQSEPIGHRRRRESCVVGKPSEGQDNITVSNEPVAEINTNDSFIDVDNLPDPTKAKKNIKRDKAKTKPVSKPKKPDDESTEEFPQHTKKGFNGLPVLVSITIVVFAAIIAVVILLGSKLLRKSQLASLDDYNKASSNYITANSQIAAYKRLESADTSTDNVTALSIVDMSKLSPDAEISVTRNELMIKSVFNDENTANGFINSISSRYQVAKRDVIPDNGKFRIDSVFSIK